MRRYFAGTPRSTQAPLRRSHPRSDGISRVFEGALIILQADTTPTAGLSLPVGPSNDPNPHYAFWGLRRPRGALKAPRRTNQQTTI